MAETLRVHSALTIEDAEKLKRDSFFRGHIQPRHRWLAFGSLLCFIGSAAWIYLHKQDTITVGGKETVRHDVLSVMLIFGWMIGPPLFFLLEYVSVGLRPKEENMPDIEAFKFLQDVCSKLWIAAAALLIFLYAGKIPGGG